MKKLWSILICIFTVFVQASCSPAASPSPTTVPGGTVPGGPGGGAIVQSNSLTTGTIVAIRSVAYGGYPWQLDIKVEKSEDVGGLPNPTKDKIGQVITCNTDQDVSSFKTGQTITGNIKYVGDVPRPGITLYIYNIKAA